MRISLTTPLAAELETEIETDILTDEDRAAVLDHVVDFVEFMLDRFPICPTCLPELVSSFVNDVVLREDALTEHQNAPTSPMVH